MSSDVQAGMLQRCCQSMMRTALNRRLRIMSIVFGRLSAKEVIGGVDEIHLSNMALFMRYACKDKEQRSYTVVFSFFYIM